MRRTEKKGEEWSIYPFKSCHQSLLYFGPNNSSTSLCPFFSSSNHNLNKQKTPHLWQQVLRKNKTYNYSWKIPSKHCLKRKEMCVTPSTLFFFSSSRPSPSSGRTFYYTLKDPIFLLETLCSRPGKLLSKIIKKKDKAHFFLLLHSWTWHPPPPYLGAQIQETHQLTSKLPCWNKAHVLWRM